MSDEKNKVTDKASEIAKNIWLAGVGAYGKAVDEAQGRLEKAGVEPPKLFRELVKAGAALEQEAKDTVAAGQSARASVEERINRVRDNFNQQRPARIEDLMPLHEKIDRLSAQVEALTAALAGAGIAAKPAARRKSGATRKAATRSKKSVPAGKTRARAKQARKTPAKKRS